MSNLHYLSYAIVLGTSVWTAYDAYCYSIPTSGSTYSTNTGGIAWLLGCLLLWVIVFPFYLVKRMRFCKSRRIQSKATKTGFIIYAIEWIIIIAICWPVLSQLSQ